MERYILTKPITYDGEEIKEIILDLDGLSVADLERAEREAKTLRGKRENSLLPEFDKKYQSCVAAKASGLPVGLFRSLGGKDYTQICLLVQNFLLDGDSEEDQEETSSNPVSGQTKISAKQENPTVTEKSPN